MIQLRQVAKVYGGRTLFRDLTWQLAPGERIGLVGPNGAGKTTLCRIIAGLEAPDEGEVSRPRGASVGYLPQEVGMSGSSSPLVEALSGFDDVWRLEREMEELAERLAVDHDLAVTARYGELQQRFEAAGGYRLESEAKRILGGLGFAAGEVTRPLTEFSGGWRMRAALARLLLLRPAVLLLDEPTNHLDLASLAWLEDVLAGYDGTVVVVSHDRYFLNRMVTTIADLNLGLAVYHGDYDDFLVEREARRELLEAQARNQAKRVAEIEKFIERFRYKATKARQVQSRIKMLARMDRVETETAARQIRFHFPEPPRTGRRVIALRSVHKAYGDNVVYAGLDFEAERGERVALVGPNGAGKSTLLRMLAGVLAFDGGERVLGANVAVHYYAQHQLDALDPVRTALEEMEAVAAELGHTRLRTILGSFLFSGDAVDKRVAVLSGGEKARLALARMLVRPAALLALDEPTNHLDLASREVVEGALAEFAGTIVFISHDRYFINRIATRVVEIERGHLTSHLGTYDDYLDAKGRASEKMGGSGRPPNPPALRAPRQSRGAPRPRDSFKGSEKMGGCGGPPNPPNARTAPGDPRRSSTPDSFTGPGRREPRRRADGEARKRERRLQEVERRIAELESRLGALADAMAAPDLYRDADRARAVVSEEKDAQEEVAWLLREWEELSTEPGARD